MCEAVLCLYISLLKNLNIKKQQIHPKINNCLQKIHFFWSPFIITIHTANSSTSYSEPYFLTSPPTVHFHNIAQASQYQPQPQTNTPILRGVEPIDFISPSIVIHNNNNNSEKIQPRDNDKPPSPPSPTTPEPNEQLNKLIKPQESHLGTPTHTHRAHNTKSHLTRNVYTYNGLMASIHRLDPIQHSHFGPPALWQDYTFSHNETLNAIIIGGFITIDWVDS